MAKKERLYLVNYKWWRSVFKLIPTESFYPLPGTGMTEDSRECLLFHEKSQDKSVDPPKQQSLEELMSELVGLIERNDMTGLCDRLKSDFIVEVCGNTRKTVLLNTLSELRGHTYDYLSTIVRPTIEQIALNKMQFIALLDKANEHDRETGTSSRTVILDALQYLQIEDESIDFSRLDLTGANFANANLGRSRFTDACTRQANFRACNLQSCEISQDQLDTSANYDLATVSAECWGFWNESMKQSLMKQLDRMTKYAERRIPENNPKRNFIQDFCNTYKTILSQPGNPKVTVKQKMLSDLQQAKATTLTGHRNFHFLIKESIAIILLAGVGYLALASFNLYKTGYFGIFTTPRTLQQANDIERLLTFKSY